MLMNVVVFFSIAIWFHLHKFQTLLSCFDTCIHKLQPGQQTDLNPTPCLSWLQALHVHVAAHECNKRKMLSLVAIV